MDAISEIQDDVLKLFYQKFCADVLTLTSQIIDHFQMYHSVYKTHVMSFSLRVLLTYASISLTHIPPQSVGNRTLYGPRRFLQSDVSGIDISTCRLW